ncbi:MAG: hypothetical protein WD231_02440 [Candidatus Woykebacteria bacterium]
MLNQNVPNPLAKNPNLYTHKVFAAIGIILIVIIIICGGIWYFAQSAEDKSPTVIKTSNWKSYSSEREGISYTVKYPLNFKIYPNLKTDQNPSVDYISNQSSLMENSKPGDISISISVETSDTVNDSYSDSKLGNVEAKRKESIGSSVHGPDSSIIDYEVPFINGKDTLMVSCYFMPAGDKKGRDACEKIIGTFNIIVDKTLKWDSYTNDKFKYFFKYPSDLVVINAYEDVLGVPTDDKGYKTTSKIYIQNAAGRIFTLSVFKNNQSLPDLENKTKTDKANSNISKLQISGVEAIDFKRDGTKFMEVVNRGQQFEFAVADETRIDEVLQTFKFL